MDQSAASKSENGNRLYNPVSYAPLAFLFSFILPGILFSLNAGKLRNARTRNFLIALFVLLGSSMIATAFLLYDKIGTRSRIGFVGINLCVGGLLYAIQEPKFREWRAKGGMPRSILIPIGITIGIAVVAGGFVVLADAIGLTNVIAEYKDDSNGITYDSSIAKEEVAKIANQLKQTGIFENGSQRHFRLRDAEQQYQLIIPIKQSAVGTAEIQNFMKELSECINNNGDLKKTVIVVADSIAKESK